MQMNPWGRLVNYTTIANAKNESGKKGNRQTKTRSPKRLSSACRGSNLNLHTSWYIFGLSGVVYSFYFTKGKNATHYTRHKHA